MLTSDYSVRSSGTADFLTQSPMSIYRKAISVCSSVAAHLLLLVFLASSRNTPLLIPTGAGKAGSEISVVNLNQAIMPVAVPLPSLPQALVALPKTVVVDRADIVVERKKVTTAKPSMTKVVTDSHPVRPRPEAKSVLQPVPTKQTATSAAAAASVMSGRGGDAAADGESTSGRAMKGGGSETTPQVRVLNRRVNYPARARSMGLEGRVKVQFDITASGTIRNIQILAEDPAGVFSSDLRRDITRWRYDITGEVKNQIVTVIYKLDGRIQVTD